MNAPNENPTPRVRARIEIIPLIDVIFFLLATFVLFTLSLTRIQSIWVELPQVPPPDQRAVVEPISIQVSAEGLLFWNREPVSHDDLPARLMALKQGGGDPRVLVAGDDKARFGAAVIVLDQVRQAGIEKVSLETRARRTGQ
jgi:biopolymer transport protein ExbD